MEHPCDRDLCHRRAETFGDRAQTVGDGETAEGEVRRFPPQATAAFKNVLGRARVPVTVRLTRGDIAVACVQLAATG
jgi:hypothetical protein